MSESRSEEFLRPYREAVERFGPGFEATLWGTREAQALRFDVMIDIAALGGSIVDVGCGPGAFAARLIERDISFTQYVGLDALPEVIDVATAREYPRSRFEVRDVLDDVPIIPPGEPCDFVCLSGTLNTMDESSARRLVERCFEAAAQGVVFNFLSNRHASSWDGRALGPARRFDTIAWLDWALELSSRVAFSQDYMDGHDATILIRHG